MKSEMQALASFFGKYPSNKLPKHSFFAPGSFELNSDENQLKLFLWVNMPENLCNQALTRKSWSLFCDVKYSAMTTLFKSFSSDLLKILLLLLLYFPPEFIALKSQTILKLMLETRLWYLTSSAVSFSERYCLGKNCCFGGKVYDLHVCT